MPFDRATVKPPHLLGGIQSVCLLHHGMIIAAMENTGTRSKSSGEPDRPDQRELERLAARIKDWGAELGFQKVGVCDTELGQHEEHLLRWLENGFHGEMGYMERHGTRRSRPPELIPGTLRVITARMDYLTDAAQPAAERGCGSSAGTRSRECLGREEHVEPFGADTGREKRE